MSKFTAIVLSAGRGSRMNSDIPKQYLPLMDKPVIYYSLKAFEESQVDEIILVTGSADIDYCQQEIVDKYKISKVKAIVPGGKERYDSVYEGVKAAEGSDYILIHDGARPVLTQEIIARCMEEVQKEDACVVGMPIKDTIKVIDDEGYSKQTPDRSHIWIVQTPQCFSYSLMLQAYHRLDEMNRNNEKYIPITDDAMLVEQTLGKKSKLIAGSYENIKITTPEDLRVSELFLKNIKKY